MAKKKKEDSRFWPCVDFHFDYSGNGELQKENDELRKLLMAKDTLLVEQENLIKKLKKENEDDKLEVEAQVKLIYGRFMLSWLRVFFIYFMHDGVREHISFYQVGLFHRA